jgi:hypothetical protein
MQYLGTPLLKFNAKDLFVKCVCLYLAYDVKNEIYLQIIKKFIRIFRIMYQVMLFLANF